MSAENSGVFRKTKIFLEMIKFEHSIFALPFAYLGMVLAARGWPGLEKFILITAAMVSFRTLAMAANRLVDAPIDALNPRTAGRALPAGLLKKSFAWTAALVSAAVFEAVCFFLSPLCFALSPIPFVLALAYPYFKRFSYLCHFLLGLVLGIAPYGAWLAAGAAFSWVPGFMTLGVAFWVAGFDIIYALLDVDFDRRQNLYSIPARLGELPAKRLAAALHASSLLFWLAAGKSAGLKWIYFAGIAAAAVLMFREHLLIKNHGDTAKINEAFFKLNAWISVIVFAAALGGML